MILSIHPMGQRLAYWILLGAVGSVLFFLLRPKVDFSAGEPIQQSRAMVEGKTSELARELGFSVDSLNLLATRSQHLNYYRVLADSLDKGSLPAPARLNRENLFLNSWVVTVASVLTDDNGSVPFSQSDLMGRSGRLQFRFDDSGSVRRVETNPGAYNPTFVPGDSLMGVARSIVGDIFDYTLDNYRLAGVDIQDTSLTTEPGFDSRPLAFTETEVGGSTAFHWVRRQQAGPGPERLMLQIQPKIREVNNPYGAQITYGASLKAFRATGSAEPEALTRSGITENVPFLLFFISAGLLAILVFYMGLKHINKGQVEWKRALFVFLSVMLAIFLWRVIFLLATYNPFLPENLTTILVFNFLLFGAVMGLYGALAYVGWEASARRRREDQLELIDAFWQFRFFFRETGEGVLRGYALAGLLLGVFALMLYLTGLVFYQSDSQFGFMEPSLTPKLLTINVSAWLTGWLVMLGHVGIAVGFLRNKLTDPRIFYPAASLIVGILLATSGIRMELEGSIWLQILVFTVLALVMVFAYNRSGLVTVSVAWWTFTGVIMVLPYWGSESMEVGYVAWVQGFLVGLPMLVAIAAYRYGDSITQIGGYIPEYQERIANHLRMEKEIEIARESQFKLMPLRPPVLPGVDVYGFFLPSFEVGGDYYDYVISRNGTPETESLTMTIVDVSGKAMKAAMHAVFTSGLLLSRLSKDHPSAILREVAPTLYQRTDPQTFITCIIAQYFPHTRKISVANAGHCLPVLKRNGTAEFMRTPVPKFPLGLRDRVDYESLEVTLEPGDFLLFYSDGLPEAVDSEGNRFGFDKMVELVEELDTEAKSSNEIAMDIKRRVQKFSDYQLADDTTIICMKVEPDGRTNSNTIISEING